MLASRADRLPHVTPASAGRYNRDMDDEQLAELEMHLAAGTDLPTALAALPDGQRRHRSTAPPWLLALAVVALTLWWFLR